MRLAIALILILTVTGCYDSQVEPLKTTNNKTVEEPQSPPNAETAETTEATFLADALKKVQAGEALLVDVRTDEEWNECHFDVAKHIPVDKIESDPESAFGDIKKEQTVFIHWRGGKRASMAAKLLEEKGYNVVPMKLKYDAMKEAGFEEAANE